MTEIDLSLKNEYYSQVNNKFFPEYACMPTSFIMALIYNGIHVVSSKVSSVPPSFIYPIDFQPEDFLMVLCRSPWGYNLRDKITWAVNSNIEPNQVHQVISEIVNKMVGFEITKFVEKSTFEDLTNLIITGKKSVVVSGKFTSSGHAVVVCGLRIDDSGKISHILVDDPYGNYFTNYKDKNGNNTWFPKDIFCALWSNWYHVFDKLGVN
jgi:hypothetical protein